MSEWWVQRCLFKGLPRDMHSVGRGGGITAAAVVWLAAFPLIGNALALLTQAPRRWAQVAVLAVSSMLVLYGMRRLYVPRIWGVPLILASSILVAVNLIWAVFVRGIPSLYAGLAAASMFAWLSFALMALIAPLRACEDPGRHSGKSFGYLIVGTVTCLALVAYFKGPQSTADVFMAFGGSPSQAGAGAAVFGAVSLVALGGWHRRIVLLLSIYLGFLATARVGILLFFLVLALALASSPTWKEGIDRVALSALCLGIVVLPARFSTFYPYFTSRVDKPRLVYDPTRSLQWAAFTREAGGFYRGLGEGGRFTDWDLLKQRYLRSLALIPGAIPNSAQAIARGPASPAEARLGLALRSLRVIKEHPMGSWPRSFEDVAQIPCGEPPICPYPHNLLLEIGFHFGWIPLGLLAVGLVGFLLRATKTLRQGTLIARVSGMASLIILVVSQTSGNLLEHLLFLSLGVIWMTTQNWRPR